MKKLLLSSAIAATMGASGLAHAAVDLDNSDAGANGSLTYASELDIASTGTAIADSAGDVQDFTGELGFSINNGSVRFIRIELNNGAEFTNAPALVVTDGATPSNGSVAQGGAGESFVVFEVTAGAGYAPDDTFTVDVDGVTLTSEADVTASYALYETGTAAATGGTSLANTSQVAYRFASALEIEVEDAGEGTIDVTDNSTSFVGPTNTTNIAQIQLTMNGNLWNDSEAAVIGDVVAAGTAFVVSGDFSAVPLDGNDDPDVSAVQLGGANADELTATEATFVVDATAYGNTAEAVITMTVDGDTEIMDGDYTAVYDVEATAASDVTDQDLGVVGTLEKNGSTASSNLVLTPQSEGGAFRGAIRIINTSSVAGDVFVRLRNDLGASVSFPLSDVEGQPASLEANSATSFIWVDALYDAAQAEDETFEVGENGRNKLRVTVEGEFGTIELNNVTVSTDNTTFATF